MRFVSNIVCLWCGCMISSGHLAFAHWPDHLYWVSTHGISLAFVLYIFRKPFSSENRSYAVGWRQLADFAWWTPHTYSWIHRNRCHFAAVEYSARFQLSSRSYRIRTSFCRDSPPSNSWPMPLKRDCLVRPSNRSIWWFCFSNGWSTCTSEYLCVRESV